MQLVIEATASNDTREEGIIAIDDITLSKECTAYEYVMSTVMTTTKAPPCGSDGFRCSSGKCISNSQLCDFIPDCSGGEDERNCGECNFEKDLCGWYDNSYGDHFWNRTKASLASIATDSTLGKFQ